MRQILSRVRRKTLQVRKGDLLLPAILRRVRAVQVRLEARLTVPAVHHRHLEAVHPAISLLNT